VVMTTMKRLGHIGLAALAASLVNAFAGGGTKPPPIVWERLLTKEDHMCNEAAVAVSLRTGNVLVVARLSEPSNPLADSRPWFWSLDPNGETIQQTQIPAQKAAESLPAVAKLVGIAPLDEGGVFAVVRLFDERTLILHVGEDGQCLSNIDLGLKFPPVSVKSITRIENDKYLLLGSHEARDAYALEIDGRGKQLWRNTYDRGQFEYFYSAFAAKNGELVLVGSSFADAGMLVMGESKVWIVNCDDDGKKLTERAWPGRYPVACMIPGKGPAVLYDRRADIGQEICLALLRTNMEENTRLDVFASEKNATQFRMTPFRDGELVIAGSAIPWLWMSGVSDGNKKTWVFEGSAQKPYMGVFDLCSVNDEAYICTSVFGVDDKKRISTRLGILKLRGSISH
jgi:hypothetical protein